MVSKLKIIPLGGLGEIGKNMTAYEFGSDIIVVDCGMGFPAKKYVVFYLFAAARCVGGAEA